MLTEHVFLFEIDIDIDMNIDRVVWSEHDE